MHVKILIPEDYAADSVRLVQYGETYLGANNKAFQWNSVFCWKVAPVLIPCWGRQEREEWVKVEVATDLADCYEWRQPELGEYFVDQLSVMEGRTKLQRAKPSELQFPRLVKVDPWDGNIIVEDRRSGEIETLDNLRARLHPTEKLVFSSGNKGNSYKVLSRKTGKLLLLLERVTGRVLDVVM